MQENIRFGTREIMVYADVSNDGHTSLHIIQNGALTCRWCRNEILKFTAVPLAATIGDNFMLTNGNCRSYLANLVDDFPFGEGIVRMEWLAYSLDMNKIALVLDNLGRRVARRLPPSHIRRELKVAFWRNETEYPSSSLTVSLTPCIKRAQQSGEIIFPIRNSFLRG